MGGVGIYLSFIVCFVVLYSRGIIPRGALLVLGASSMAVLGFVDDIVQLRPYAKLVAQIVAAIVLTAFGATLQWTPWAPINQAITVVWLVGVTNAMNLLDNIDGLSSGIGVIAALFMAYFFYASGHVGDAVMLATFAGALLGFLVYNFNPASIFMGDSGSLFIGYFLGGAALYHPAGTGQNRLFSMLAAPVLILAIPILDTTLVTVTRKLHGRPISQGGRDHTSHRLVALGLSERGATVTLYLMAVVAGLIGVVAWKAPVAVSAGIVPLFLIATLFVTSYLGRVKVYAPVTNEAAVDGRAVVPTMANFNYKRRIVEVMLDFAIIVLAAYSAFLLRFDGQLPEPEWSQFRKAMPIVVSVQITAFLAMRMYGGAWRYTSLADVRRMFASCFVGMLGTVAAIALAFGGLEGFSRGAFVVQGPLLFLGVGSTRVAFRIMRDYFVSRRDQQKKTRVLIYGAGDAGELLLRELRNNDALGLHAVGFVDDDPRKVGDVIHGLQVFSSQSMDKVVRDLAIREVLLSTARVEEERFATVDRLCADMEVKLRRARFELH
jgi:UDP-GlcNAc:undecaprenyl-phosphate GlcNAc-1-phosphate transferase